jgi:hypothetical protein
MLSCVSYLCWGMLERIPPIKPSFDASIFLSVQLSTVLADEHVVLGLRASDEYLQSIIA